MRQSLDGGERRIGDDSEQLEPILEQLATHVPDLIVFRSHDAPLPQTIHSYGIVMFGDISGKVSRVFRSTKVIIMVHLQVLQLFVRGTVVDQNLRVMVQIS